MKLIILAQFSLGRVALGSFFTQIHPPSLATMGLRPMRGGFAPSKLPHLPSARLLNGWASPTTCLAFGLGMREGQAPPESHPTSLSDGWASPICGADAPNPRSGKGGFAPPELLGKASPFRRWGRSYAPPRLASPIARSTTLFSANRSGKPDLIARRGLSSLEGVGTYGSLTLPPLSYRTHVWGFQPHPFVRYSGEGGFGNRRFPHELRSCGPSGRFGGGKWGE